MRSLGPLLPGDRTLLTVGSVLHFARDGDVLWGTGVNGKIKPDQYHFTHLDVRAVRGPRTRDFLLERGIACPEVYGDPALLLPIVRPDLVLASADKKHGITIIPNLNDVAAYAHLQFVDPRGPLNTILETIAQSELVVGSSLHGIVVAEALGVPARLVGSARESPLKYEDYYLGTNRSPVAPVGTVEEAIRAGGAPLPSYDPQPLLDAFPDDLWETTTTSS